MVPGLHFWALCQGTAAANPSYGTEVDDEYKQTSASCQQSVNNLFVVWSFLVLLRDRIALVTTLNKMYTLYE